VCPAAEARDLDGLNDGLNGGRLCWARAGSFCTSATRGRFAGELPSCLSCDFFQCVRSESIPFVLMKQGEPFHAGVLGGAPSASAESLRARLPRGTSLNCWEYFHCGREPGGDREHELGVCPAAAHRPSDGMNRGVNAGRACWKIAGTFCFDQVQGSFAQKAATCLACDFFSAVRAEEGHAFQLMRPGETVEDDV